eukprot:Nitzschia sp. Nitz4//scaffold106_size73319//59687//62451//NITZ4_005746-RA/size73319-processed-gene-0.72-mRNA-1//-1//CDS//3329532550//7697//frame0
MRFLPSFGSKSQSYWTWRACQFVFSLILLLNLGSQSLVEANGSNEPVDYLNENSVVLITGAAGFIGSELALALHRTYSPKKILCVDRMGDHPSTQEELALFEIQRQRAFLILQALGTKARFYRVDFRPMIPEYFDMGEVPVLDHIFRENPDISHVVHLADPYPYAALQVIPREKDVPKAGMMEALLEQFRKIKREGGRVPHFSYASSFEVYPYATNSSANPLAETQPITTPSSMRGASKLIDEVLAKLYYDEYGLFSVGLRLFSVYGPWSVPGSPLYEMAERAVSGELPVGDSTWSTVQDYVYIDDAVDAIMTSMQFRPAGDSPHPLVVNVASGTGSSLEDIARIMAEYFPRKDAVSGLRNEFPASVAIGSIERAKKILGYQPQVSLREGVTKLLAWHYDRAFPYGSNLDEGGNNLENLVKHGVVGCLPNDTECLRGAPVFPCASECAHASQCTTSYYDDVIGWTQALTAQCSSVMYTVDLRDSLESIPSAHVKVDTKSDYYLEGSCNLAFVSSNSPLVVNLRSGNSKSATGIDNPKLLQEGKWIIVPLSMPSLATGDESILAMLPKLSPGLFFAPTVKHAVYVDPDIVLTSVSSILREASMQPYHEDVKGATAMLIGRGKPKDFFAEEEDDFLPKTQQFEPTNTIVQNAAYRMVRIAVSDNLFGDGFMALLDSRWMVHTLQSDDSRVFRCDVLSEVSQWEVDSDKSAFEFILGLHDMWSRVIAENPWWIDENVVTVPQSSFEHRRLQEVPEEDDEEELGEIVDDEEEDDLGDDDDATDPEEDPDANLEDSGGDEDSGGFRGEGEGAAEAEAEDKTRGDSSEQDDDENEAEVQQGLVDPEPKEERDFSAYDNWMGILSATSVKYFVRIVVSSEVGVVSLQDYGSNGATSF